MLTLKLMSEQDLPDENPSKDFTLVQLDDSEKLQFLSTGESGTYGVYTAKVVALITAKDGSERAFPLVGNAYVMNGAGRTIANRSAY
jgi:hypothetical protein